MIYLPEWFWKAGEYWTPGCANPCTFWGPCRRTRKPGTREVSPFCQYAPHKATCIPYFTLIKSVNSRHLRIRSRISTVPGSAWNQSSSRNVNVGSPGLGNPELIFFLFVWNQSPWCHCCFRKNAQTAASALWNGTRNLPTLHYLKACGYYLVHFFHVHQLLPIRLKQLDLCCIGKYMMKHQQNQDWNPTSLM